MCGTIHVDERGFGDNAPNKLMASAEGKGSEHVSDLCRRHGHKLVYNIQQHAPRMDADVRDYVSIGQQLERSESRLVSTIPNTASISQLR
jgi:hypothetical protein